MQGSALEELLELHASGLLVLLGLSVLLLVKKTAWTLRFVPDPAQPVLDGSKLISAASCFDDKQG
jgi:hypothetical protein